MEGLYKGKPRLPKSRRVAKPIGPEPGARARRVAAPKARFWNSTV